jgi:hypothetical protein
MQAAVATTMLRNAEQASAKMHGAAAKIVGGGGGWKGVAQIAVWLACFATVVWLFFWHDAFEADNQLIKQWVEIEMLIFALEIPF